MAKGKKQALIDNQRQQIEGLLAYQRTLQQHLEIAKRDAEQARAWAEEAEKANATHRQQIYALQQLLNDGEVCG